MARKKKIERLPSLKEWAEREGVDIHVAEAYQRARKRWMQNVSRFAKKYGTVKSKEIPVDVRILHRGYGMDFEDYIGYRASEIAFRSRNAQEYLLRRQDKYLATLVERMGESPQMAGDKTVDEMSAWLNSASAREKGAFIAELGGAALEYLAYTELEEEYTTRSGAWKKRKVRVDVLDYDFSPVVTAVRKFAPQKDDS